MSLPYAPPDIQQKCVTSPASTAPEHRQQRQHSSIGHDGDDGQKGVQAQQGAQLDEALQLVGHVHEEVVAAEVGSTQLAGNVAKHAHTVCTMQVIMGLEEGWRVVH